MSEEIASAKQKLPLPALMHRFGLDDHAKKSARCPFHDHKHNSFSVWKDGVGLWFWKCHTGCGEGDEITFLEKHKGISNKEATKLFLEMAGVNGAKPRPRKATSASTSESASPFDCRACVTACTDEHVEEIARERGFPPEFVRELREAKQIGIHDGLVAFPVCNDGRIVGTPLPTQKREVELRATGNQSCAFYL